MPDYSYSDQTGEDAGGNYSVDNYEVDQQKIRQMGLSYQGRDDNGNRIWTDDQGHEYTAVQLQKQASDDGGTSSNDGSDTGTAMNSSGNNAGSSSANFVNNALGQQSTAQQPPNPFAGFTNPFIQSTPNSTSGNTLANMQAEQNARTAANANAALASWKKVTNTNIVTNNWQNLQLPKLDDLVTQRPFVKKDALFPLPRLDNKKVSSDKLCICQTGLDKEKFKNFFDIKTDYLFSEGVMKKYPTYMTPIVDFLGEFEKLFGAPYNLNNCYRKAHFLAQSYIETAYFQSLEEKSKRKLPYDPYRGRGVLQLTFDTNYKRYGDYIDEDLLKNYIYVASKLHLAVDSGGWFWKNGVIIKHKPADFNKEADERHTDTISRWITGGFGPKQKSGERKTITDKLLEDFNAKYCINIAIHK